MARTPRSLLSASRLLVVLSCLLCVLALLPTRAISWAAELSRPLTVLLAPVQDPLGRIVKAVVRRGRAPGQETPEIAELRQQADEYKFLWLNEREENERLERQIVELQKGLILNPELVRPVYAPVIGPGIDLAAGLLKAKAGERDGVIVNSVAVVEGVQLVGRVTRVESRYCLVLPITQKASRPLRGVIMLKNGERGPFCDLTPTGGGVLRGRVLGDEGVSLNSLEEGMEVRLDDPEWPASARMLVIGVVAEVTPLPQLPTRPVVTVRPKHRIDSISEMVIRVPVEGPGGGGGGGAGGPTPAGTSGRGAP